jgi:hypothetical protein
VTDAVPLNVQADLDTVIGSLIDDLGRVARLYDVAISITVKPYDDDDDDDDDDDEGSEEDEARDPNDAQQS